MKGRVDLEEKGLIEKEKKRGILKKPYWNNAFYKEEVFKLCYDDPPPQ